MSEEPDCAINARSRDEPIAGTAPGIPDDALKPGQDLPEPPTEAQVRAAAEALGTPVPEAEDEGD